MADEGASPRELVLEACRRNNTELLEEVIESISSKPPKGQGTAEVAKLLNNAQDGIGNGVLHLAATNGSYEVLDILLDQEGLEIDEVDRLEKDTPLHKAVRYVNSHTKDEWESAHLIVEILLDAGCDPRIRNKAKLRPIDLVDPRNTELRKILQNAEFTMMAGDDVVEEEDDGPTGSASDSE
ncbi:ankyrin repeat protein-like protein [Patellaria atrata CBS 101060]|uniref:Ankyrin repeat protein-like protein n=1 Tax=Patellaria atrata CBS 101060 TaxID=1346257 RepID=A0A9P4S167_9PEZI|nr:ankyrin repeat protein-like protein [Patellaria atrata CBS 101060]